MAFFQFIDPINIMTGQVGFVSSQGISTTDSTDFLQKLRITASDLAPGEYRVVWTYSWNLGSTSQSFESRVQIDDTDTIGFHREGVPGGSGGALASTGSSQVLRYSGIASRTLSGTVNIDLDWRSTKVGVAASIWEARLELWRIS